MNAEADINLVELACLWEATVPKPGNVHPGAAFSDTSYDDFVQSAKAIAPVLAHAEHHTVGEIVLDAVRATRQTVGKNTNLGIILVLAPLAKSANQIELASILHALTVHDTELVYEAIRLAQPGGLGKADSQDVHQKPTATLLEAMQLAADRDWIARQYVRCFADVFGLLLPELEMTYQQTADLTLSIQRAFLVGLATLGDTLIARKCGEGVMKDAQLKAQAVLDAGWPDTHAGQQAFDDLDHWLRADGHRRNPGTMADLMAGAIYLALRKGSIPIRFP
ncbi:MAG: triphosphoribosyl-dephospho-CoA synthase [Planctomycetia bacterium]|nr:triphosphoribosyl-dephospho-CoA synthase [Planctomycetia bacterium]